MTDGTADWPFFRLIDDYIAQLPEKKALAEVLNLIKAVYSDSTIIDKYDDWGRACVAAWGYAANQKGFVNYVQITLDIDDYLQNRMEYLENSVSKKRNSSELIGVCRFMMKNNHLPAIPAIGKLFSKDNVYLKKSLIDILIEWNMKAAIAVLEPVATGDPYYKEYRENGEKKRNYEIRELAKAAIYKLKTGGR
jgi:hypothetical protein